MTLAEFVNEYIWELWLFLVALIAALGVRGEHESEGT